jgi:hypothetical protein
MKTAKKTTKRPSRKTTGADRFHEARKSLEKMQEEIAPYIKTRRIQRVTTAGKWRETSALISEQCLMRKRS